MVGPGACPGRAGRGAGATLGPLPALGQSRDADPALEALIPIPRSTIPRPGRDTDAARTPAPDVSTLISPDPLPTLPAMPGITLEWPDKADLPAIEPLSPIPTSPMRRSRPRLPARRWKPMIWRKACGSPMPRWCAWQPGVLAFPPDAKLPDRDAIVARFKGLSALATLKDDEDNLAQLTRRAKSDAELLQQMLRVYGYYDPGMTQTIERPATTRPHPPPRQAAAPPARPKPPKRRGQRRQASLAKAVRFDIQPGPQYLARIALGDVAGASDGRTCAPRSISMSAIRSIPTRS
jgi:translocation and assembly module TamA